MSRRALALAFATLLVLTQAIGVAARSAPPPPDPTAAASARVEKGLAGKLAKGELSAFVVEFAATANLEPAAKVKGWEAKGKAVVASLQGHRREVAEGGQGRREGRRSRGDDVLAHERPRGRR